jgi:hypothetical protein
MQFRGHQIVAGKGTVAVVDLSGQRKRAMFTGNCPRALQRQAIALILSRTRGNKGKALKNVPPVGKGATLN